jgi:Tol biopolymer transport system component
MYNRRLYAVGLSGEIRVVAQVPGNLKLHDIAADGRVLLTKEDQRARVYFAGAEESTGRDLTLLNWATQPVLSADGRTLLMTENDEATHGKGMVYLRGTDGSPATRLGEGVAVSLSPDTRWVATTHRPKGLADIQLLPVKAGASIPIETGSLKLAGGVLPEVPMVAWFPDSQRILFPAMQPGHAARTFVQDIRGGQPRPVTPEGIWGSVLSADGAVLLAYDAQSHAFLFPVEGGTPKPLPFVTADYRALTFSKDGRSLYAVRPGERPPNVWRIDLAAGSKEIWRRIPSSDPAANINSIRITPDGKSLAYVSYQGGSELYLAHGLR